MRYERLAAPTTLPLFNRVNQAWLRLNESASWCTNDPPAAAARVPSADAKKQRDPQEKRGAEDRGIRHAFMSGSVTTPEIACGPGPGAGFGPDAGCCHGRSGKSNARGNVSESAFEFERSCRSKK